MKTGIVILNYNDLLNTTKMLNQIKDYKCLDKIVVVDNCSTDNSLEELKKYKSRKVIILEAKENKGYANGNNLGLKYLEEKTKCELIIISNPDVMVDESVIEEMINDLKSNQDIAFLGPKILEQGKILRGWKFPTFLTELISNINFFHRLGSKLQRYSDKYYKNGLNKVDVLHGCFFMGRTSAFKKIDNFDPNTFLYYEENILAKKAATYHLDRYVDTRLSVSHMLSYSVDKSLKKIAKYKILKQSQKYYIKEYMKLNFIFRFFIRFFYYISLGISYLTFWI